MQVDPQVNRQKFDLELARLEGQHAVLESKRIFLLRSTHYPIMDLLFVPRHPLQLLVPTLQFGPSLLGGASMKRQDIIQCGARAFKARFDLADYDLRAPSLEFRDPWDDHPLQYNEMSWAFEFEPKRGSHLVLVNDHPISHKPFLCVRGVREYHEHPQHSGDDWLLYRHKTSLFSLVMTLWRASVDLPNVQA